MLPEAESWAENEANLKGPLAGIPISLKDSIAVRGFDVSVGYSRNTGKPYAEDGSLVKILKAAGQSSLPLFQWLGLKIVSRSHTLRQNKHTYYTPLVRIF